jgi:hypothetical protein
MDTIKQAILNQYQRTLLMFREAIKAFPEDEWRVVKNSYPHPAAIIYHTLEAIDYYTSGKNSDEFSWGHRFEVVWETKDYDRLPSQQQIFTYLDEIETRITNWLKQMDLSAPEKTYSWTGGTKLENAIYLLRHTHQHTAELTLELHKRGYQAPNWR